ncbi:hypothetical protein M9H77_26228 [Catharanthus roseus]|uniref:Uncharacterized protein n=1 Tax=Catharanthus roseus TaxID=4058 RepID=A0ACC0AAL9_CATRO|nr:hypothetical protein M9H77_26228 [Catharanthus roseus]
MEGGEDEGDEEERDEVMAESEVTTSASSCRPSREKVPMAGFTAATKNAVRIVRGPQSTNVGKSNPSTEPIDSSRSGKKKAKVQILGAESTRPGGPQDLDIIRSYVET